MIISYKINPINKIIEVFKIFDPNISIDEEFEREKRKIMRILSNYTLIFYINNSNNIPPGKIR